LWETRSRIETLAATALAATAASASKLPVVIPTPPKETASSQTPPPAAPEPAPPAPSQKPLKPSWLSPLVDRPSDPVSDHPLSIKFSEQKDSAVDSEPPSAPSLLSRLRAKSHPVAESEASKEAAAASAKALLDRLRGKVSRAKAEPAKDASPSSQSLLRIRRMQPSDAGQASVPDTTHTLPPLKAGSPSSNDLRDYLAQRIAAAAQQPAKRAPAASVRSQQKVGNRKFDAVLISFDAVLDQVLAVAKGSAPRAVLVSGVVDKAESAKTAIRLGRALAERREQVVLVDVTRGSEVVSGPLGLPRAPGFTDLIAGRSSFADVVRVDEDTPLQIIAAGNPKLSARGDEAARFARLFEALTQAYDCVVLHADRETVRRLASALKFELPLMIAVLPQGEGPEDASSELDAFAALGCPVVHYEHGGRERRTGLLGRVAAI
jgi:Mrp family chromosome partitioning ATPase